MPRDTLAWWAVKAVLSAAYWLIAAMLVFALTFGDRIAPLSAQEQAVQTWSVRGILFGVVLFYTLLSAGWNRLVARTADRAER